MNNALYTQLVHLFAIVAMVVLMSLNKLDTTTGVAILTGLVGIALPSPFKTGGT